MHPKTFCSNRGNRGPTLILKGAGPCPIITRQKGVGGNHFALNKGWEGPFHALPKHKVACFSPPEGMAPHFSL
jgi:hypothetical protein